MSDTNDYIRDALDDVETTLRRIPLATHLRSVDPALADRLLSWISEVQKDRQRLSDILSCWDREAREDRPLTMFLP